MGKHSAERTPRVYEEDHYSDGDVVGEQPDAHAVFQLGLIEPETPLSTYIPFVRGHDDWPNSGAVAEALLRGWLESGRPEHVLLRTRGRETGAEKMAETIAEANGWHITYDPDTVPTHVYDFDVPVRFESDPLEDFPGAVYTYKKRRP